MIKHCQACTGFYHIFSRLASLKAAFSRVFSRDRSPGNRNRDPCLFDPSSCREGRPGVRGMSARPPIRRSAGYLSAVSQNTVVRTPRPRKLKRTGVGDSPVLSPGTARKICSAAGRRLPPDPLRAVRKLLNTCRPCRRLRLRELPAPAPEYPRPPLPSSAAWPPRRQHSAARNGKPS